MVLKDFIWILLPHNSLQTSVNQHHNKLSDIERSSLILKNFILSTLSILHVPMFPELTCTQINEHPLLLTFNVLKVVFRFLNWRLMCFCIIFIFDHQPRTIKLSNYKTSNNEHRVYRMVIIILLTFMVSMFSLPCI